MERKTIKSLAVTLAASAVVIGTAFGTSITADAAGIAQIENASEVNYKAFTISNKDKQMLSKLFDATYYAKENPDVVAALIKPGMSEQEKLDALFGHFLSFGIYEQRAITPNFNATVFNSMYNIGSDLAAYRYASSHDLKAEGKTITTFEAAAQAGVTVNCKVGDKTVAITPQMYQISKVFKTANVETVEAIAQGKFTPVQTVAVPTPTSKDIVVPPSNNSSVEEAPSPSVPVLETPVTPEGGTPEGGTPSGGTPDDGGIVPPSDPGDGGAPGGGVPDDGGIVPPSDPGDGGTPSGGETNYDGPSQLNGVDIRVTGSQWVLNGEEYVCHPAADSQIHISNGIDKNVNGHDPSTEATGNFSCAHCDATVSWGSSE